MISIIAFIIVIFGSMNWLSIGLFQYDIVAGLFGYQGSIFSRMVYIVVGICACWLIYSVIKNKGSLNAKKLKHEERVMYDKHAQQEQVLREINQENTQNINPQKIQEGNMQDEQSGNKFAQEENSSKNINIGRNHANI